MRSLLDREQREQGEQSQQSQQPAFGAALGAAGAAARAQRGGGGAAALRAIVMEDFVLAKQTLRVSTAMDTPARESMMKWHGRFGEGGKNTTPSNIGF